MKKTFAILLALVMVLSLATAASAASITVNPKIEVDTNSGESVSITYSAYKIFDAVIDGTDYTYTIESTSPYFDTIKSYVNVSLKEGTETTYVVDANTLTAEELTGLTNALLAIINANNSTITADGTATSTGDNVKISNLATGYYLVTSTLGSAVIVDTLGDETIETKNLYPTTAKDENKTTAAYGETVTYTVPVTIPATANGPIYLHDTMTGLTYNNDVAAKNTDGAEVTVTTGLPEGKTCEEGCTVHFVLSADVVAANLGKTVTLTYTADVNAEVVEGTNTVQLEYNNYWSPEYTVEVKNYKFDVYKTDGTNGLKGAGFVVKNADSKYYYKNADGEIEWVDDVANATELISSEENGYTVTFDGLANGTYTLIESTVPGGYTKANDLEITIEDADQIGENKITVVNKSGTELPSTGGVGTTLFYVFGSMMVVGAAIVLVTKKRMGAAE